ncbi:NAD(P)H-binding protein [Solihabitans fulvus]|uniref:NAD(P)H-binding protein n=1 Tax=Solihabitans fulvus TaxID=1892852 RepID=UPI001CB76772|nr:NAD(P)H-binding protein [Solihabitans fulvus]
MILVTGATGNVGRNVLAQLLDAGETVRVTSRNPAGAEFPSGVEVVRADLTEPATLPAALNGVDRAFLFPTPGHAGGFLDAATAAGLERVVLLSAAAVSDQDGGALGDRHAAVEQAVTASGLAWTFLRPGPFMVNDLRWAPAIRATGVVRAPYGRAVSAPIDERDIAAVAVHALLEDGHEGRAYELTGGEPLSTQERVRILGDVLGRELTFQEQPTEEARQELLDSHVPVEVANAVLALFAAMVDATPELSPWVREVTGRAPLGYADWAANRAADFR